MPGHGGGALPSISLKGWRDLAQEIVALNRRNRRKVRILDMDMAARHPGAFLRWFALDEDQDMIAALSGNRQPDRDEVLHLLARRILLGDTHARALTGELKAVSLNFAKGDDTGADNPDAAFLAYRACLQTRAQVSLLQAQNRYMQDETEAHLTRAEAGQAEKQQRIDALTADLSGRDNAVAALELELQRFLASKSYRLTAPLRRIRALLSRGAGCERRHPVRSGRSGCPYRSYRGRDGPRPARLSGGRCRCDNANRGRLRGCRTAWRAGRGSSTGARHSLSG